MVGKSMDPDASFEGTVRITFEGTKSFFQKILIKNFCMIILGASTNGTDKSGGENDLIEKIPAVIVSKSTNSFPIEIIKWIE